MTELLQFIGRFHPLLVHLPIGILLLAGVLEIAAWIRRRRAQRDASSSDALGQGANAILALGAVAAIGAAVPGYLLGTTNGYAGPTYDWHFRLGTLVAIGATLTAVAGMRRRAQMFWRRAYAVLLPVTLTLLVAAGHLGATLAHGEGYLTDYAPPVLGALVGGRTPLPHGADADSRVAPETIVVYTTFVEPVLDARCGSCHGPNRAEGGLRLDSHEAILKGGNSGPVIIPGRADDSELVRRVFLPPAHEDVMPPKGQRAPAPAEAALLRWWIDQGASADRTLADAALSPEILSIVEAVVGPLPRGPVLPRVEIPAASPDAIETARRAGFSVQPVAEGVPFLHVHCTNSPQVCDDQRLRLLEPLAAQVLWLDLGGTAVTDEGLAALVRFTNLTRLHLQRTAVSDEGLVHLRQLRQLEYLNLYGTRVSDEGVQQVASLGKLRTLYLWQTGVTDNGIARLEASLPRLEIVKGEAF